MRGFKKVITTGIIVMTAAALSMAGKLDVHADTAVTTVSGTVSKGTTSDTLYLFCDSQGTFSVKLDSNTDTSRCRLLVPGKAVTVAMYRGDDACMHAQSIVSGKSSTSVTIDSNRATVQGKVLDKSTEEVLYLDTKDGEMVLKIDPTTDFSGTKLMVAGKTITVVCSRGSDAYMHAISISDNGSTSSSSSGSYTAPSGDTTAVSGTPTDKSTGNVLYLNTSGGTMYLVVDEGADTTGGFMFTPNNKLTAYVYRGSDANMHAAKVTGTRASGATVSGSSSTFSGSVDGNSTEDMLLLVTSGGTMKIRLDQNTSLSGTKGLTKGKVVTVTASVGSDEYWHALSITAR
ncbi:MAG: hypothetical protein K6E68_00530 [Lachnospiraceae bacterium]|nr:hypothetical protein [Lachnospiraceae bacterium]